MNKPRTLSQAEQSNPAKLRRERFISQPWRSKWIAAPISLLAMTGCSLAPDFELPEITLPEAFKEQPKEEIPVVPGSWVEAMEQEGADRGEWWKLFGDEKLNELQTQARAANPTLEAAFARVEQARASVRASASTLFPTIELGANAVRSQPSSAGLAAFGGNPGASLKPYTLYSTGVAASYEVDLFGRVRDNEKALLFTAEAEEDLYRNVLLALQADVAQHYFLLRAADTEIALLEDTLTLRTEAARIMQKQADLGEAGAPDLSRTLSELAGTEAELLAVERRRAILEHALATLLGKLPSEFTLEPAPLDAMAPVIPAGLPSTLLQRRPDIAAAINLMQAANARIGVARTAFFPSLVLTATGGVESTSLSDLFQWSNRMWALGQLAGSALTMTVFDSGRNIARVDRAQATYEESVANYRAQVLAAFRDVEDALSEQRLLAEQAVKQDEAATAATRTTELTQLRYDEGDVNYFEVVDAQRGSLAYERAAIQTRGQRFVATVALIRALGGGWGDVEETKPKPPSAD